LKTDDPERLFLEIKNEYNEQDQVSFMHFCDYLIRERMKKFDDLEAHSQY